MANFSGINVTGNTSMFNVTPVELPFMDKIMYGNTMQEYLVALIYFVAAVLILKLASYAVMKLLERFCKFHKTAGIQESIVAILKALQLPLFIIIGIKIASTHIALHADIIKGLDYALLIIITYYVVRAIIFVIRRASKKVIEKREKEDKDTDTHLLVFFTKVIYIILWILAFLFVLSQFGVDISKVLTGLGIAGIAVAFALQNVLADIFASVSIYFDKPFKPGEYIIFEGEEGTVVRTGIKSTRIKTLRGEELSISNRLLTDAKIHNTDRMETRRVDQDLQIKYGTPRKKLEKIPKMLEGIVKKQKKVEFSRCHLKSFKDYSIEFELIYFVNNKDYNLFMDTQQKINFEILKAFEKEKIEFAFPTRTIVVESSKKRK
ncbi:MAG: mechanosensitive ion channel family protein [Candidatus Nanoarchaeia archaeon]